MKTALTIAGSDSSGGAGIQADLKTFLAHDVYGMSAITSITAQNTQGVQAVSVMESDLLAEQIKSVFDDSRPGAVKIGMVGNSESIDTIVGQLKAYEAENIVIDPVMVATSGANLFNSDEADSYEALFQLADLLTPNIYEAEQMLGRDIKDLADLKEAAIDLSEKFNTAVLVKGGHLENEGATDVLAKDGDTWLYEGDRIANANTHGTGCTLSSAIAANLAKGQDLTTSIQLAKDYITGAISQQLNLGQGTGPLDHAYAIRRALDED